MMQIGSWFKNLTKAGQISVLSAVVLGGLFTVSAMPERPVVETADTPVTTVSKVIEPVITTKVETEEVAVPFSTSTRESALHEQGDTHVEVAGVNGIDIVTHKITLTDGVETDRVTSKKRTKNPVNEVTVVGTYVEPVSNCDPNYSGCIPKVSYDLDCGDIGVSVVVYGYDSHGFDRDGDGYGCESY